MADLDVAIVGLGPVGALLANLLGAEGLEVGVFEREGEIHPLPRAVHFDGEAMRIFQAAGLAERIAASARPSTQGMHFVSGSGQTLLVRRGSPNPGPQGWAGNWYFHQPLLEAELRRGLSRFPNVQVALHQEVTEVEPDGRLRLGAREIAARYVVGCDGGRSLVRRAIGAGMDDLGLHQPWLVVDLLVDPQSERVRQLPEHTVQHCDPRRPMTAVHVGGTRRRWEIMLLPGDDPERMQAPEVMWCLLAPWIGPADAAIERSAIYTFHSVIARPWRRDRLLLAGDSCHQTPPFLGQGLCAGLRDAMNLGWKLAHVLRGGDAALLDSYESERRPHVEAFIALAVKLGGIIQATDPAVAAERDRSFAAGEPTAFDFPQPQLGPGCRDQAPPPVGQVFPQPLLADGRRLDDAIGGRFAVLGRCDASARWRALGAAVIEAPGSTIERWLDEQAAQAVVLRPDRYVFGLARDAAGLDRLASLMPKGGAPWPTSA